MPLVSPRRFRPGSRLVSLALVLIAAPASAQVHYHDNGLPWSQRAGSGPDAEVPGWFYNLGITGLRARLSDDEPTHLVIEHVFEGSPADNRVRVGDHVIGASGNRFEIPHRNGYGMDVFGAEGPIRDFADALELAQTKQGAGKLKLTLLRGTDELEVVLPVGTKYGSFGPNYPSDCPKSKRILDELLEYLITQQGDNGSWGQEPYDTFAPLALLASGNSKYRGAIEKNVRFHANTTAARDESGLINWRYMAAGIVLSEYYLATREKWVLAELEQVRDFLMSSQYVDRAQLNPKSKESHPDALPKGPLDSHGGFGHNPGFEGYGPIAFLTAQGALAFSLMARCGIDIDKQRHDAMYAYLRRGSGANHYVWYGDSPAGANDWADMGRTGVAAIAHFLAPYQDGDHRKVALDHAKLIGDHPESFPDTHGSPILGMGFVALGGFLDGESFRSLLDANRYWFALSQCHDGTFYYQPNRDNAGYGSDSRLSASAVTAFILTIPRRALAITGKPLENGK
jgi:Family of unknown function (DUF6288)